ncbi:DUF262 domain-containing protein [Paraburkholderia phymatum]|uniref:DUF262 domain-containing protein n=1 Tax=Paraburkholderia phymatum TaxID=148447 RepID=A0ACC6U5J7_9BURK
MKPFSRSVIELFDGKKRYVIPMFQRQYVWSEQKQLPRLWEDIKGKAEQRLANRSTMPHFLGAAVIAQIKTFGNEVQAYDVIDGQQRLTTFQILLTAFRDVAASKESEYADELAKYIINDGIMKDKAVERFKLWPTQVDRAQIRALADSGSLAAVRVKEANELGERKTGVKPNMIAAYRYFYDRISGFVNEPYDQSASEERIQALFQSLKNDLALVSIELEGDDDPQVIFETLNGFNEPLLPTDLMRNFVFQRAYREERGDDDKTPEQLYDQYWLPFDRHFWKREEKQGRLKRPRIDIFFQHFLAMKRASEINVGRLYYEYRDWILNEKPYRRIEEELQDAEAFAGVYRKLLTPEIESDLSEFAAMLNVFDVKTISPLMLFLCGEAKLPSLQLQQALSMLESYLVRRAICGLTTKNYNHFFLQLVQALRGTDGVVEKLTLQLREAGADATLWPDDATFSSAWMSRPLYSELSSIRLQYIMKRIEQAKRKAKNEDITIHSALTVEHVMPVAWWTHWPLSDGRMSKSPTDRMLDGLNGIVDDDAAARDKVIHTMGNLTMLTASMNSSLQNAPYVEKRPEILRHSALSLNREFHDFDIWDEGLIDRRGRALFALALKIWPRNEGPVA